MEYSNIARSAPRPIMHSAASSERQHPRRRSGPAVVERLPFYQHVPTPQPVLPTPTLPIPARPERSIVPWAMALDRFTGAAMDAGQLPLRELVLDAKGGSIPSLSDFADTLRCLGNVCARGMASERDHHLYEQAILCVNALWDPSYTGLYSDLLQRQDWTQIISLRRVMDKLPSAGVPSSLFALRRWQADHQCLETYVQALENPTLGPKARAVVGWLCALEGPVQDLWVEERGRKGQRLAGFPVRGGHSAGALGSFIAGVMTRPALPDCAFVVVVQNCRDLGALVLQAPGGPGDALHALKRDVGGRIREAVHRDRSTSRGSHMGALLCDLEREDDSVPFAIWR